MPRLGFEPTISLLERAKMVHASDGGVTAIGSGSLYTSEEKKKHVLHLS
jgi:hypothetical protein